MKLTLHAAKWGGSMIAEAALAQAGLEAAIIDYAWGAEGIDGAALKSINPLAQVPTLVLPDGRVLSESAAIIFWLNDMAPEAGLVPGPGDPSRPKFFRWLMMLNAAIYPTFSYGDYPKKWLKGHAEASAILRETTDRHRERLLRFLNDQCSSPWFLGGSRSALDLYIWVLRLWRPGEDWFQAEAPKLFAIATALDADPRLAAVRARQG